MPTEYPNFPELSRAPQMDEEEDSDDPTIRDKMENGAVFTRPRWKRIRETVKVNYRYCSFTDRRVLRDFKNQVGGWDAFWWVDKRDSANPVNMLVRFTKLPTIKDDGIVGGQKTFKFSFEVTQV